MTFQAAEKHGTENSSCIFHERAKCYALFVSWGFFHYCRRGKNSKYETKTQLQRWTQDTIYWYESRDQGTDNMGQYIPVSTLQSMTSRVAE